MRTFYDLREKTISKSISTPYEMIILAYLLTFSHFKIIIAFLNIFPGRVIFHYFINIYYERVFMIIQALI